ncbi:MAG: NFACT family protein [Candidatus Bilamarchaeaceae archaeon]
MRAMCAVEYTWIAAELKALVGKRLSKLSKTASGYRFRIGDSDIICQPPIRIHTTKYIEESEAPDRFVEGVRRELRGRILRGVEQINNDRVLMFDFGEYKLYFEMFAKGNIVLTKDGRTIVALRYEQWADREIRPNHSYIPPKAPPQKIKDVISDKYIIVSLLHLPLGKEYVEELLAATGVQEKTAGISITEGQIKSLEEQLEKMKMNFKPYGFYKDGKLVDFGLLQFSKYIGLRVQPFASLSEAADEYYWENQVAEEPAEIKKLQMRLAKQQEYLEALKREEEELRKAGDWFYANYQYVETFLSEARAVGLKNLDSLMKKYKEIRAINKGKKEIEIEI